MVFHLQRRAPQECGVGLVIETINVVIFCWGKSVRKYFTLSDRDTKKPRLIPELWYQAEKNAIHYRKFVKHVIEVNSRFKDQPEHFSFRRILSHKRDSYDYSRGPLFCKISTRKSYKIRGTSQNMSTKDKGPHCRVNFIFI